jgi:electron transfer flavoprotein beta subunit
MDIVVCVKQVPVTAEAEVMVDESGRDIRKDRLVFDVNEADNYAVEEALQLTEKFGGTITLINLGPESADKTLRSLLAKGSHEAVRLTDEHFDESDALATARILAAALKSLSYDLVLTGCYSSDLGYSQVGAALAELLGIPHATMVIGLEVLDGKVKVERELEGGDHPDGHQRTALCIDFRPAQGDEEAHQGAHADRVGASRGRGRPGGLESFPGPAERAAQG